jgi:hypothetical protein
VGKVVRLPVGAVTLQDAADAFLNHHDLARSTQRVLPGLARRPGRELGPATAVDVQSDPKLADWFRGRHMDNDVLQAERVFPPASSLSMSMSNAWLATSFLSWAFSASSSRSRLASLAFIPPYWLR